MMSNSQTGIAAQLATIAHPTILVAEDSTDSREMMEVLLGLKGYQVISASDGLQAIEAALQQVPDLILIDLRLPKMDGLSVTRHLRSHPKMRGVPIIVVSGYEAERYREAALDAGCDDYLMKPIDFDNLESLLRRIAPIATAANP